MDKQFLARLLKHSADTGNGAGVSTVSDGGVEAFDQVEAGVDLPQSQSELDSLINKAVQAALKNRDTQHAKEMEAAVSAALQKEKDYSQLSEQERKQREFEDEWAKLDAKKAQFAKEQLVVQLKSDLLDKGLPTSLAKTFALHSTAEEALAAVMAFEKDFNAAVAEAVTVSLRQATPGSSSGAGAKVNYGQQLAKKTTATGGKIVD